MLLPSILQILGENSVQSTIVKSVESGFKAELGAAIEGISGSDKIEAEITNAAADLAKPSLLEQSLPEKPPPVQNLDELLRIITKFQKPNQKRVVDVFE
jgi:hypothetical protein